MTQPLTSLRRQWTQQTKSRKKAKFLYITFISLYFLLWHVLFHFLSVFSRSCPQVIVSMFVEEIHEENWRMFACFYLLSLLRSMNSLMPVTLPHSAHNHNVKPCMIERGRERCSFWKSFLTIPCLDLPVVGSG